MTVYSAICANMNFQEFASRLTTAIVAMHGTVSRQKSMMQKPCSGV